MRHVITCIQHSHFCSGQQRDRSCLAEFRSSPVPDSPKYIQINVERQCLVCNRWYEGVYHLHHIKCEKQSRHIQCENQSGGLPGPEYTRRLRSYFRWLRLGTDDPRRLDPSPLIGDVRQPFGTRPDASLSSQTEPPSSTRTREASTS